MNIERLPSESYLAYAQRLTDAVNEGLMNWQEWADSLLGAGVYTGEACVRSGRFFRKFLEKCAQEPRNSMEKCDSSPLIDEMKIERQKLQDTNRELQETYRNVARADLRTDRIVEAMRRLEPIAIDESISTDWAEEGTTGLLLISDIHAGSTYQINGLDGTVVNKYDKEVLVKRMNEILDFFKCQPVSCENLVVGCLGDFFEGVLREGSLLKLRESVIDTVIWFSEFYANWLAKLHKITGVPMRVITIGGNHDIVRMLTSKPIFEDENYGKLVQTYVALRLRDVDSIDVAPYSEFAVEDICGQKVALCHGVDKDLATAMDYFSNVYDTRIDLLYAGHLHENSQQSAGVSMYGDRECRRIGSICGLDTFSHKIRKASRPSCYFALFDGEFGKTWERTLYL